jgi:hypothetical protein
VIPKEQLAQGFYEGVCVVHSYMRESARPMLRAVLKPSAREQCVEALFLRSLGWIATLEVLTGTLYFQAIAACTRAMLEATVDIVLLCNDPQNEAPQKMVDWTLSAKFKLSEQVINFYSKQGSPIPEEHHLMLMFHDQHELLMPGLRAKYGWSGHPDRWTGRNLPDDCLVADGLEESMIRAELEMTFLEFYHTHIRRLNWFIHSSGIAGVQNVSKEVMVAHCALAFKWSSDLGMLATKLALRNAGFIAVSRQIVEDWEALKSARLDAFRAANAIVQSNENV